MSFKDIKGQDSALGILTEGIRRGRIFSNYLFAGPEGVGKFLTAVNFAKAVNCLAKENAPCEKCISCRKINSRTHPDVFFIEPKGASSSIGIAEIRSATRGANLKPYQGKKKVFIINNADAMNKEAANAFLKTLEEPPENSIFILISRSKEALLPTVVSRSHVIKFFAASSEVARKILTDKFSVGENEAEILSNFSSGRIGKAIEMKERNLIERKNRIVDSLTGGAFGLADELGGYADRNELREDIGFLISYMRDIFLYKTVGSVASVFHHDRISDIKKECARFTLEELDRLIKKMIELSSYIDYNVNPGLVIDVLSNRLRSYYARGSRGTAQGSR